MEIESSNEPAMAPDAFMSERPDAIEDPAQTNPRRPYGRIVAICALAAVLVAAARFWQNHDDARGSNPVQETTFMPKLTKSDAEWRAQLTSEQYEVTRNKGTERAFTGAYWNHKEPGTYRCVCCGEELFTSETKYDSGCGWPSFFAAENEDNLHVEEDRSWGMVRTEVMCKHCGAHLGHLFDDGPAPSGQRYCINSASLAFEKGDAAEGGQKADP